MGIDFSKIESLKAIRIAKSELSRRETEMSKPLLTDLRQIKTVYDIFSSLIKGEKDNRVVQRKKFIFIAMYLFSPISLVGNKTQKGVREEIGKVLEMRSKSTISNNLSDMVFQYKTYAAFRSDIDILFGEIVEGLKVKELIK